MSRVTISYEFVQAAMQHEGVRAALAAKAGKIAARAESLASQDGVDVNVTVSSGTRPKGRPYSRVESGNVAQEWGNSNTARRRILGRAAEGG